MPPETIRAAEAVSRNRGHTAPLTAEQLGVILLLLSLVLVGFALPYV